MSFDLLEREALNLPPNQRVQLADSLATSLPMSSDLSSAWAAEISRREAMIECGQANWLDGESVVAELRAKLR